MTRHTVEEETPNSGPSCRIVRFVRQCTATISTRSASGSDHGRPRSVPSPPRSRTPFNSPENCVTQPRERLHPHPLSA